MKRFRKFRTLKYRNQQKYRGTLSEVTEFDQELWKVPKNFWEKVPKVPNLNQKVPKNLSEKRQSTAGTFYMRKFRKFRTIEKVPQELLSREKVPN